MNCGCDERREVMFTYGNPDVLVVAIVVLAVAAVTWSYLT
jgi:hypothetical protein